MNKNTKTGDDFRNQAKELKVKEWPFRRCSICGVMLGYKFVYGKLYYDSNCLCVRYTILPQQRDWDDIAEHWNQNQHNQKYIEEMNQFWQFNI